MRMQGGPTCAREHLCGVVQSLCKTGTLVEELTEKVVCLGPLLCLWTLLQIGLEACNGRVKQTILVGLLGDSIVLQCDAAISLRSALT
jgi:hypothetical protein